MHNLLGYSTHNINDLLTNISLRGIKRLHPHQVKQASPITPEILLDLYKFLDKNSKKIQSFGVCFFLHFSYLQENQIYEGCSKNT